MTARRFLSALAVLSGAWTAAMAQDWPVNQYDPARGGDPADLVLPMPCGGAMAFQKVVVPVDAADPLADRRVRLGQSRDQTGYSDYLRPEYLRGAFEDPASGTTFYYIGRYEVTQGQYRALQGDCGASARADRLAQGGLAWFDALEAAQTYSGWLLANRPEMLPKADGVPGFARLPTEAEWEYATRGGARIDETLFPAPTFFGDADMHDFARIQGAGSGRGNLGPVGLRGANPLGLYDVYGNAEELMLEPFRLNAIGRAGGQVGGIVTRGGSVLSTADQIYSAQRTEYPPFDLTSGAPLRSPTFGMRLVIATHIATSDARLRDIQQSWLDRARDTGSENEQGAEPLELITNLIDAEIDPGRRAALNGLKLEFRRANDRAQTALQQSARATLLSGAVFVESLDDNAAEISAKASNIRMLIDLQRAGSQSDIYSRQLGKHVEEIQDLRHLRSTLILSYRATLESLTVDVPGPMRQAAYNVLREELSLSGRESVLILLDRFWNDIPAYAAQPDQSPDELLLMALD